MANIKFFSGKTTPIEMHRVRIIQKLNLRPIDERLEAIKTAGNNTFLLKNNDVFLDMLTDSGVNAMSNDQLAAMSQADDSYAGSATFYRLEKALQDVFGMKYFLPAHQGSQYEPHRRSTLFVGKLARGVENLPVSVLPFSVALYTLVGRYFSWTLLLRGWVLLGLPLAPWSPLYYGM